MTPPVDSVARRDRAMNGALGSWIATLKPTAEVLRSFHPETWAVFVILATCLIMAGLYPFFAASNAVLVFTVASLGCLVGSRIGQLAVWSGSILVPRYTRSLFALCVSGVVLATLLTGLVCWSFGNPAPAVAPAMLVGVAMMRRAIRRPVVPRVVGRLVGDPGICHAMRCVLRRSTDSPWSNWPRPRPRSRMSGYS